MLIDEPELDREVAPKMSAAFFGISRSIRSRLFSRRKRAFSAFSAARSDGDGTGASVIGRRAGPVAWPPSRITHRTDTSFRGKIKFRESNPIGCAQTAWMPLPKNRLPLSL